MILVLKNENENKKAVFNGSLSEAKRICKSLLKTFKGYNAVIINKNKMIEVK